MEILNILDTEGQNSNSQQRSNYAKKRHKFMLLFAILCVLFLEFLLILMDSKLLSRIFKENDDR